MSRSIKVNAWQRNADVSFNNTNISESIQVRPSSNPNNPTVYAETIAAAASGRRADGQEVIFRPWFNLDWGDQPRAYYRNSNNFDDPNNWYNLRGPYEPTVLPSYLTSWWDSFNNRIIELETNPDYIMLDNEVRPDYWGVPSSRRQAFFAPITVDDENNPYPNDPNPYLGISNMGATSNVLVGQFISEYNQYGAEDLTLGLDRLHGGSWSSGYLSNLQIQIEDRYGSVPESENLDVRQISNYRDAQYTFDFGDTSNRPERLPYASTRISLISAPVCYFNRRSLPLFQAEGNYVTTRQIANRERWKSIIFNLNEVRSCAAAEPGDVHPWIQSPGWGWNGGEGWATSLQLPFELLLWRTFMAHLEEMGISRYNLWNPIPSSPGTNDPNSFTTHTFMANYFTDREVADNLVRDLTVIDYGTNTITTGSVTTRYSDLFEIETFYYQRSDNNPIAFMNGFGSQDDPLIISQGSAGDSELSSMVAAIENELGYAISTQEVFEDSHEPTSLSINRYANKIVSGLSGVVNTIIRGPQIMSENLDSIIATSTPEDSQNTKLGDREVVVNRGVGLRSGKKITSVETTHYEISSGSGDLSLGNRINYRGPTENETETI